jgi:aspartate/methionine/tyrosine aminotransferase
VTDLDAVRTQATRAVVICSPHNPTGAVHGDAELEAIVQWAAEHDIWVISDDTYRDLCFTDVSATPRLALDAGCDVISIGSTSKSHAMTGWRTGWLIAPPQVTATAIAIQSHTSSNVGRVAQAAALAALTGPDVAATNRRQLRMLRDELMRIFSDAEVIFPAPEGAFYLFPPTPASGASDDAELAGRLLQDAGVAVVPGSAFGAPGHVRVSYAGTPDVVTDGVRRLAAALGASR